MTSSEVTTMERQSLSALVITFLIEQPQRLLMILLSMMNKNEQITKLFSAQEAHSLKRYSIK